MVFTGQGRFSEARADCFIFFQINSDKLRAPVVILDLRELKFYNIFNDTTVIGAVEDIVDFKPP